MIKRFHTAPELVEYSFNTYPNHQAYTCLNHTLTYKELDVLSARFAHYLQNNLKLEAGDRLAIQLPNILQFPVVLYGAIRAGIILVNVNPLYTARELEHQLKDSGAKALVVLSNVAKAASEIISNTSVKHIIVTQLGDLHPLPKKWLINFAVKYIKKMVPPFHFDDAIAFSETINHSSTDFVTPTVSPDDIFVLQYTGGTTGVAKGAMLTHENLCSNVWQMLTHMPDAYDPGVETFVACLPLYHIYAFNVHALTAFCYGEHNLLIPNPRDLKAFVAALKEHKFTVMVGINTLFTALCRFDGFEKLDFSHLKLTSSGGMALTADAANAWKRVTGCDVLEGYGLTESSPIITTNPYGKIRLGSIGVPFPETDIKLISDDGEQVAHGEPGELTAKGPQVMKGYWNNASETDKVFTADGYLKTGDIAVELDGGYFKIVDRKKDMIIVSGFNVYPNEIEDVISGHPDVVECAAVGMPDAESGERVKVFIVAASASLSAQDILDYCHSRLTGYKRPKEVVFKPDLPKSAVGKVLRRELRD